VYLLKAVEQHRSIVLVQDCSADFDSPVRPDPKDVAVEGCVVQLAQREPVGNDGLTAV
jgi:hypothetical protein